MKLMRLGFLAALGTLCLLALGSTAFAQAPPGAAQAELFTGQGVGSGVVALRTEGTKVRVRAELRNLPPGFHGFHVHAVGSCQAPTFTSAGGHLNPTGAPHPSHEGDMPVLLVRADGSASINFTTDRFRLADLFDADGSAIIVHANPDNYANIPRDRYDPDPDATTLATGDAGGRLACGALHTTTPPVFPQVTTAAARADMQTSGGADAGFLVVRPEANGVRIRAELTGLPPGFHGFHVHAVGSCEAPTFMTAGGHLNPTGAPHPGHEGDMPVLLVQADGTASINFTTDRFRLADLFDADGSAIIVHANPDNYANIPADRYDPDPDAATLATGDAGGRIACGTLETLTRCEISVRPNALRAGERATLQASIVRQRDELLSSRVRLRGPGIARTVFASGGRMSVTVRPRRAGQLTLGVAADQRTLGCRATRPVLPKKPPPPPAVSG